MTIYVGDGIAVALYTSGYAAAWGTWYGNIDSYLESGVQSIVMGAKSFAAVKADGTVATTGQYYFSQSALEAGLGNLGVTKVVGSRWAFAALKTDGSVHSWGFADESDTSSVDISSNIVDVVPNSAGFAAIKDDGTILTWGRSGSHDPGSTDLSNVVQIVGGDWAFAALKTDGSVVTWGAGRGGDSSSVASELASGVLSIQPPRADWSQQGFVAWKAGNTAVIWGYNTDGTHIALPSQSISDVKKVEIASLSVGVLKNDGTVITAGRADDSRSFADSSSVAAQLTNVVDLVCPAYACAALKVDGTVVTWGYADWFGSRRLAGGSGGLINIQRISGSILGGS